MGTMYNPACHTARSQSSQPKAEQQSPFKRWQGGSTHSSERQYIAATCPRSVYSTKSASQLIEDFNQQTTTPYNTLQTSEVSPVRAWLDALSASRDGADQLTVPCSIKDDSIRSEAYSFESIPLPHTLALMNKLNNSSAPESQPKSCKSSDAIQADPRTPRSIVVTQKEAAARLLPNYTGSTQSDRLRKRQSRNVDSGFDDLMQRLRGEKKSAEPKEGIQARPRSCIIDVKAAKNNKRLSLSPDVYSKLGTRSIMPEGTSFSSGRIPATKLKIPACFAGL